jgi:hypothetical protein
VVTVGQIERMTAKGSMMFDYDQRLTALMRKCQEAGSVVYLEDTYLAPVGKEDRNVQTLKTLCKVAGEIEACARRHRVPVVLVTAGEWRAAVLGRTIGREDLKAMALKRASIATGRRDLSEHMADAVCIAQYGAMQEGT